MPGKSFALLPVVMVVAACSKPAEIARDRFQTHVQDCAVRTGYDPGADATVGEHTLAVGERAWRECVYEGIQRFLVPHSPAPEGYATLIAEDRAMTDRIAAGTLTRDERRARIEQIGQDITAREEHEIERQMRIRQIIHNMDRGFYELQRTMMFDRFQRPVP